MFIGYVAFPLPHTPWWPQLNPLLRQRVQKKVRDNLTLIFDLTMDTIVTRYSSSPLAVSKAISADST